MGGCRAKASHVAFERWLAHVTAVLTSGLICSWINGLMRSWMMWLCYKSEFSVSLLSRAEQSSLAMSLCHVLGEGPLPGASIVYLNSFHNRGPDKLFSINELVLGRQLSQRRTEQGLVQCDALACVHTVEQLYQDCSCIHPLTHLACFSEQEHSRSILLATWKYTVCFH